MDCTIKAPSNVNVSPEPALQSPKVPLRGVPEWYRSVNATHTRYRGNSLTLRNLKTLHNKVIQSVSPGVCIEAISNVRTFLHQMALFNFGGNEKKSSRRVCC